MIDGLIAGKVHGQPTQKTSKTGKGFVTTKVRAHAGDGDVFVNVIAFSDTAQDALLGLGDGDAVSLAGTLKPSAWMDRDGKPRPGLDMVASAVLTVYHIQKKRKGLQADDDSIPPYGHKSRKPRPDHTGLDDGSPLEF